MRTDNKESLVRLPYTPAPIQDSVLEYMLMVKELNELDHICTYTKRHLDSHLRVTDRGHFWEITKEEALKQLIFLRKLRGVLPGEDCGTKRKPKREPWRKERQNDHIRHEETD